MLALILLLIILMLAYMGMELEEALKKSQEWD